MGEENRGHWIGRVLPQFIVLLGGAALVVLQDGIHAFRPFLNWGVFAFVIAGAASRAWIAARISPAEGGTNPIRAARDGAIAFGAIASLVGVVLVLGMIDDIMAVPRRLAFAFDGIFYGVLLSEVILAPLDESGSESGGRPGMKLAGFVAGGVLIAMMAVLYALSMPAR